MKRQLLMILALATPLALLAEAKTVPYASAIYQDTDWTVVDNNADGKTWVDYSSDEAKRYNYTTNAADDWAISPAISLAAGTEYKLSLMMKTGSFGEDYKIVLGTASDIASLNAATVLEQNTAYKSTSWSKHAFVVNPTESADYYVAVQVTSKDQYYIEIKDFAANLNVLVPGDVTDLTAQVAENEELKVTLNWVNPVKDEDGADMSAEVTAIDIYRDEVKVASLEGAVTTWEDNAEKGLEPGFHTYKVVAYVGSAASKGATVTTAYVGPLSAWSLPFDWNFKEQGKENFETFWTVIDANGDAKSWTMYEAWNTTYIQYYQNEQSDDYLVSPALKFTEAGAYKITWYGWSNSAVTSTLDVVMGDDKTVDALSTKIGTFEMVEKYSAQEYSAYIQVATAGEYYIAFHTNTSNSTTFKVTELKVEKGVVLPLQATDLKAVPAADLSLKVDVSWTNASLNNLGTDLATIAKVELYRDGELIKTYEDATPGAVVTYTDEVAEAGVYTYKVRTYGADGEAEGDAPAVTSKWVGDPTQEIPYYCSFLTEASWGLWTIVDANNDENTWQRYTGYSKYAVLTSGEQDDYLIAPPVNVKAATYYNIMFEATPNAPDMTYTFGYVTDPANAAETFHAIEVLTGLRNYLNNQSTDHVFYSEQAQKIYFAWWAKGNSGTYDVKLADVAIEELPVVPAVATDLKAEAAADKVMKVTLSWTNPSASNVEGVSYGEITKAEIYRAGEKIAEVTEGLVPGETASYEDTELTQPGSYTYGVVIYNANGKSAEDMPTVTSDWVGGGFALPYSYNFTTTVFSQDGWTSVDGNNDTKSKWYPESNDLSIYSASYDNDEWAITPPLELTSAGEGSLYRVTVPAYIYYYDSGHETVTFELTYGPSLDVAEMTVIETETISAHGLDESSAETFEATFSLPQGAEGTYYLAIHANQAGLPTFVSFSVVDESTPTAISAIEETDNAAATVYNLQGLRVNGKEKGMILIQGRQKMIVK